MLCPLEVISPLVMLQTDENEFIRDESLQLLLLQDERHPNFLDNRLLDGCETSYFFQRNTLNKISVRLTSFNNTAVAVFASLYRSCIQPNKKRRNNFLLGILRKCRDIAVKIAMRNPSESKHFNILSLSKVVEEVEKVNYLLSILAALPFSTYDEVLEVIQFISRSTPNDVGLLLSRTKHLLLDLGAEDRREGGMQAPAIGSKVHSRKMQSSKASISEEIEILITRESFMESFGHVKFELNLDNHSMEEQANTSEENSSGIASSSSNNTNHGSTAQPVIMNMITRLQMAMRCFEALLRLKSFLKIIFNISDEKCSSYDSTDKQWQEKLPINDTNAEFSPIPSDVITNEEILSSGKPP